tara:strand:+ start:291 stop:1124 length:834 start_codon:yes stop_codon:yes gene_type:complete
MLCNIQNKISINLPDEYSNWGESYNNDWNKDSGEAYEMSNFIKLTKNRNVLFDIGAHVGFYSYVFISNTSLKNLENDNLKESYCFEPSADGMNHMVKILNHNKWLERIKLFPFFVGDKCDSVECLLEAKGKTLLVKYEAAGYDHQIQYDGRKPAIKDMITIDAFTNAYKEEKDSKSNVDTLKIDVEGYEVKVLLGAETMIWEFKPLIFLEIHNALLPSYNNDSMDIYNILKNKMNYKIFDIMMNEVSDIASYKKLFNITNEVRVICIHKGDNINDRI